MTLTPEQALKPDDIVCPDCGGMGKVEGFVCGGPRSGWHDDLQCFTCKGVGRVDAEYPQRLEAGHAMRKERTARGESLYAAAQRLGMTSAQLSGLENGRKL